MKMTIGLSERWSVHVKKPNQCHASQGFSQSPPWKWLDGEMMLWRKDKAQANTYMFLLNRPFKEVVKSSRKTAAMTNTKVEFRPTCNRSFIPETITPKWPTPGSLLPHSSVAGHSGACKFLARWHTMQMQVTKTTKKASLHELKKETWQRSSSLPEAWRKSVHPPSDILSFRIANNLQT